MKKIVNGMEVELTEEEIAIEAAKLAAHTKQVEEEKLVEYKQLRSSEYPTVDSLIIAIWESMIENNNTPMADLQALREAVKLKYPKPEAL